MNMLEKRVVARMSVEGKQLRAEQMALGRERVQLGKYADKALANQAKVLEALKDGKALTEAQAGSGPSARKVLARVEVQLVRLNERMDAIAKRLERLDAPGEKNRRVAAAEKLGASDKPLSGVDAAYIVILRNGKPMHYVTVTDELLETGTVKLQGKTPAQTMSAYLAKEAAKPNGRFVRIEPGVFDVKRAAPPAPKPAGKAKSKPAKAKASDPTPKEAAAVE